MITKDEVIKRINERVRLHDPRLHFGERERDAPMVHAMIAVLLEVIGEQATAVIQEMVAKDPSNLVFMAYRGRDGDLTCYFVNERGERCPLGALFMSFNPDMMQPKDYCYGCADHAQDVAADHHVIVRLRDGVTVRKAKR